MLRSRGWTLFSVHAADWLQLHEDARKVYCHQLISESVDLESSLDTQQDEARPASGSADNSNASTDDEEAFAAMSNKAAR